MCTVNSIMSQLTDSQIVLKNVGNILRKIDPEFALEEQQYNAAVATLREAIGDSISPSASEYIAAKEQKICAELIYVAFLSQDDVTLIEKKDYIENPKRNGYRSLHLIVTVPIFLHDEKKLMRVEVQFRTIAMDWWASLEHQIRYKKEVTVSKDDAKELRDCAEQAAILDYRMEQLYKSIQGADA